MNKREDQDGIVLFAPKTWLSSPTMHGDETKYIIEAYESNWMSIVGKNINEVEHLACEKVGCRYTVALFTGTAALRMAVQLVGVKPADKIFCSDMTFDTKVNPVVYEGGMPVLIDTEYDTWNMDPVALEKALGMYPKMKVAVVAHLYETSGKIDRIRAICREHHAIIIEDVAESLGASYKGIQIGTFGSYDTISFNGNKIITGPSGGMLLTGDLEAANKVRKWSTQSRENAPWYQHEELGYNCQMNGVVTREGDGRGKISAYYIAGGVKGKGGKSPDVGMDIFQRGLRLPSDNKMTVEEQDTMIEIVRVCFE